MQCDGGLFISLSSPSPLQDFGPRAGDIIQLWQQQKMTSEGAIRELQDGRFMQAQRTIETIRYHDGAQVQVAEEQQQAMLTARLCDGMKPFRGHPLITEFMAQFENHMSNPKSRYKMLLLLGDSCSGKTQKARSLYGAAITLNVNCQGLSHSLPSIAAFSRSKFQAILWDEINEKQVLSNKLVFQSGDQKVTLGQSACNQHAYDRWLSGVPMLLCSNVFAMPGFTEHKLSEPDAEWLTKNIICVRLPDGEKWYWESDEPDAE